jgi:tRNA(Ile)-lysidine synthase
VGLRNEVLACSAARIGRAKEAIAHIVDELLATHLVVFPLGDAMLPQRTVTETPAEIALRLFSQILSLIGGEAPAPRLAKLENLLEKRRSSRWKATLGGCLITASPENIRFYREPGRMSKEARILQPGQTAIWDARFTISLARNAGAPVAVSPLGEAGWLSVKPEERASFKGRRLAALTTPAVFCGGRLALAPLLARNLHPGPPGAVLLHADLVPDLARFVKTS